MRNLLREKRIGTPLLMRVAAVLLALALVADPASVLVSQIQAASVENPWDGVSKTVPETDEEGTYLIRTGAELAWFAAEVNSGHGEINGRLENYIYLNTYNTAYNWTMIGDSEEHPYQGNFDGNGMKVVYMRVEITAQDTDHRYAGLFGVIDGGTVQNLTVLGKVIQGYGNYGASDSSDQFCAGSGGIAGYLKSGQIVNCVNYARTTMEGDAIYRNCGGIVGICSGLVMHCENQGKLSTTIGIAQNHVGGIAGLVYGTSAQVVNSANYATVQGYYCVGGIAGAVKYGAEIQSSCNYGAVKGNSIIGGIAGRLSTTGIYSDGTEKESSIRNVYNLGELSGYGTGVGNEVGGIAGQVGYESWTQEALPPMPVIENAYSTASYANSAYVRRGAAVGYMLSGSYGTVYGRSVSGTSLSIVGAKNDRSVKILGEAQMLSEEELKSAAMIDKLGTAFTMSNTYDTDNDGYPKLVWQGLPSTLLEELDQAQLELNSWICDKNKKKYGKNYSQIETLVASYKDKLGAVTTEENLEACMTEARDKLNAVKPGVEADQELAKAIDNGEIALEEYCKKLLAQNEGLTQDQIDQMNQLTQTWNQKLEAATTVEEVRTLIRDGKDAMDSQIAAFEADKRLEEVRSNAIQIVTAYRSDETYATTWMYQIRLVRDKALEDIAKAATSAEVTQLMNQAKNDIDAVIDKIPEAGAWDGKTQTQPECSQEGIYQITNGSELAWFANAVNTGLNDGNLNAVLCNDISLGFRNWIPIGSGEDYPFRGSFDGQGYSVRGLSIDLADTYAGLFGYVTGGSSQTIQNLTVGGSISVDGKVAYAGGIAACVEGSDRNNRISIYNCHNNVNVSLDKVKVLDAGAGGIAGKTKNVQLSNCSNEGNISIPSAEKGGILYYVGGLVGTAAGATRIQTSYNSGTVWGSHTAGGLVGASTGYACEYYSSYNAGEVSGTLNAGGLAGGTYVNDTVFDWCYSSGAVNLDQSGRAVGALFGTLVTGEQGTLYALKRSDSLYRTLVGSSTDFSAAGKFLSDTELSSDDILNSLNGGGSCFIHDYLGFRNGCPILSWELTLEDLCTGAITELQTYVAEEDYEAENWAQIQSLLATATQEIQAAGDMESIYAIMTQTKEAMAAVETRSEASQRKLAEARDEAIDLLENYVDLTVYRDQEQTEIRQIIADAKAYILQADTVEEVERHRDEAKSKIDRLPDAWQYAQQVNLAAAAQVDSYIMSIGDVVYTAYVKNNIQIARAAYESLTDAQKELVTAYQILLDAEAKWEEIAAQYDVTEEDLNLAAEVDSLIEAIGDVTEDSGEAISRARLAYDSLTELQKTLVARLQELEGAESAYNQLKASQVITAIAAIGSVTADKKEAIFTARDLYDSLTEAQKALVTDYATLQTAITTYQNLVVAQPVMDQINALGSVNDVTLDSGNAILAAIQAYNGLTGDQQALVTNYDLLEALADVYDSLERIQDVTDRINGIGVVSTASGSQIAEARAAYDSLTAKEQKQVENLSVLEHAEEAYAALQNPTVDTGDQGGSIQTNSNTRTLEDLYRSLDSDSTDVAGTGATGSGNGTGTAENGNTGNNSSGASGSSETGEASLSEADWEETEDGSLPDWLADQLDGEDSTADQAALLAELADTRRRRSLVMVLSIIFAACGVLTVSFLLALRKAAGKRKAKQVHY